MKKETILIVSDMEGASGLTHLNQLSSGEGARALTEDIKAVVRGIRPYSKNIYIWDFDGDENNLKNEFGPKTKVLSHPRWEYLKKIGITKVFLVGFHSRAGLKKEFCPHTYSGHDIKKFTINGEPIGEATLFAHLFAQLNIPIVLASGSHFACEELTTLALPTELVPTRKHSTVYNAAAVRRSLTQKAKKAMQLNGKVTRLRNYKFDITLTEPVARFFKNTHLVIKSPTHISGSSPRFDVLYRDFVNGIFKYWGDSWTL